MEDRVAKSVVTEMSIDEKYEKKYNPHPLRNFEAVKRHSAKNPAYQNCETVRSLRSRTRCSEARGAFPTVRFRRA
jgi:hypothetical protein